MGRGRGGYSSYRGRRTLHDILKGIAVLLLILVVLLLGVLIFAPEYLRIPQVSLPRFPAEAPDPGDISLVIQPAGSQEEDAPPPEEAQPATVALELPLEAVLDASAPAQLKAAGANALILDMKNEEGQLGWVSRQTQAVQAGVCAQIDGVNEALRQWNQGETYTVARVCCFRDNTVPYHYNSMALRAGYGNWRDELGLRWLNPASADVQAYLAGLCAELAELGFDEILLDCCGFPTRGNLDAISAESVPAAETMEAFLSQVQAALAPYGTALSVWTEEAVFTGEDTRSGLTAACLETYAGRLWLACGDGAAETLSAAGITGAGERLVRIVSALDPEASGHQAVLSQARES